MGPQDCTRPRAPRKHRAGGCSGAVSGLAGLRLGVKGAAEQEGPGEAGKECKWESGRACSDRSWGARSRGSHTLHGAGRRASAIGTRHGASHRCRPAVRAGGGRPGGAELRGSRQPRGEGWKSPVGDARLQELRSRHDPREGAAGGAAGEAQRGAAAALEEEAVSADREGAAALRAQRLAPKGAELRPHEGGGVRGVEGAAHLLHGGDGRQPRDRLPLRPGGPGLECCHHHGPRPLQEPAGHPGGAGTAQLQSSGAV